MKQIHLMLIMLTLSIALFSCADESSELAKKEKVEFSLTLSTSDVTGGRMASIPDGANIKIRLTKTDGTPVLDMTTVSLLKFGDSFVSEPVELEIGRYLITDFLVVDQSSTVLFATPKNGSPLAPFVAHSLPYSFAVSKDKVSNINVEVIAADIHGPEAFGYVSFKINVIKPLSIGVFAFEEGSLKLVNATAYIYDHDELFQEVTLNAKNNSFGFQGDNSTLYRLVVKKPGYIDYKMAFRYQDLEDSDGLSLAITLTPATEFFRYHDVEPYQMNMVFNGPTTLAIQWSDAFEVWNLATNYDPDDFYTQFSYMVHEYTGTTSERVVYVTGDLEKIIEFGQIGTQSELDFRHLSNVEQVWFGNSTISLDLSNNTKLRQLSLGYSTVNLTLPSSHAINELIVRETIVNIDELIANVHANAFNKNIMEGVLIIENPPASLSAETLQLIEELRVELQWSTTIP